MMNGALLAALERIEREKGIDKEILLAAVESALVSAARKVIDDPDVEKEDISVSIDPEDGEIRVYSGEDEIQSDRFGRIAAQTAKQVIIQKIREAERDVIFGKYFKKIGTIISGSVHRFDRGKMIVELDDAEAILPRPGQIPRERFRQGETMRAFLADVNRGPSGPEIILSRTDPGFVKRLFELEVPEIAEGIVEIKGIAREAGERTKIAVCSKEEKVDPVGACVGMRGSRVRDIVKELNGERIDIVRWHDDIREYVKAAVNPAEVIKMVVDRENKLIVLTVMQDQLSLLIGKKGRNIRLASKLLGWQLQAEAEREYIGVPLSDTEGLSEKVLTALRAAELENAEDALEAGIEGLMELEGIGEKTAQKIVDACEAAYIAATRYKTGEEKKSGGKDIFAEAAADDEAATADSTGDEKDTGEDEGEELSGEEDAEEAPEPDERDVSEDPSGSGAPEDEEEKPAVEKTEHREGEKDTEENAEEDDQK